jgi:hypothetical protein
MRLFGYPVAMLLFVFALLSALVAVVGWTVWKILFYYGLVEAVPPLTRVVMP